MKKNPDMTSRNSANRRLPSTSTMSIRIRPGERFGLAGAPAAITGSRYANSTTKNATAAATAATAKM